MAGWILERVAVASLAFGPHTNPFFEGSIGALADSHSALTSHSLPLRY